jgi:hypothetical protein
MPRLARRYQGREGAAQFQKVEIKGHNERAEVKIESMRKDRSY